MNRREHLLVILMEECNELSKDAAKTLRFSPDSDYDGITNRQKLQNEFNDVLAVVKMLHYEGIDVHSDPALINAKQDKIEKFLLDSKRIGTLND